MKVCAEPTCPELTVNQTYCTAHMKLKRRQSDKRRPTSRQRGYSTRWQATRRAFLKQRPWCEAEDCGELATDVHHLDGQGPKGPRGFDFSNLQGLCHQHHSQQTAKESPAGWNG